MDYSLISGHIDGNETVKSCIIREAEEEAGIKITEKDLEVVHVMHSLSNQEYIDFFLIANDWSGEPVIKETDKCDDMQWFYINELPKNTVEQVKQGLELYQKKVFFSEF